MAKKKTSKRILQGGITSLKAETTSEQSFEKRRLDIILQSPTLFHFDMRNYMTAVRNATAIDFYNRSRLYDMYESALLDLHLGGLVEKRKIGVSLIPIEFRRDGKPDDAINEQLRAPWFRRFIGDCQMAKMWGFSLMQFYRDGKWIGYDLIDRKHVDTVKREILRYETDNSGIPFENFDNLLYVGDGARDLGLLARAVPMVLYKRGNLGDWAEYCQIFGMPIREYTYDGGDEETRKRLLADAKNVGANAVYIHPKDSDLNFIESGSKSGSSELYSKLHEVCNQEMSVGILGNTLTTAAQNNGTQALGTVHADEEDKMQRSDRQDVLDILNYDMTEIFTNLGFNTEGGEFVYIESKIVDTTAQIGIVEKLAAMGLPISDDYLYETFNVEKPEDYEQRKKEIEERKKAEAEERRRLAEMAEARLNGEQEGKAAPKETTISNRLRDFFGLAPQDGASVK